MDPDIKTGFATVGLTKPREMKSSIAAKARSAFDPPITSVLIKLSSTVRQSSWVLSTNSTHHKSRAAFQAAKTVACGFERGRGNTSEYLRSRGPPAHGDPHSTTVPPRNRIQALFAAPPSEQRTTRALDSRRFDGPIP